MHFNSNFECFPLSFWSNCHKGLLCSNIFGLRLALIPFSKPENCQLTVKLKVTYF